MVYGSRNENFENRFGAARRCKPADGENGAPPDGRAARLDSRSERSFACGLCGLSTYAAMAAWPANAAALRVLPARDGGWQSPHT